LRVTRKPGKYGVRWSELFMEALREADALITLIDSDAYNNDLINDEIDMSRNAEIAILPIAVAQEEAQTALENLSGYKVCRFRGIEDTSRSIEAIKSLALLTENRRKNKINLETFEAQNKKILEQLSK
jgi:hypothetical protein